MLPETPSYFMWEHRQALSFPSAFPGQDGSAEEEGARAAGEEQKVEEGAGRRETVGTRSPAGLHGSPS